MKEIEWKKDKLQIRKFRNLNEWMKKWPKQMKERKKERKKERNGRKHKAKSWYERNAREWTQWMNEWKWNENRERKKGEKKKEIRTWQREKKCYATEMKVLEEKRFKSKKKWNERT